MVRVRVIDARGATLRGPASVKLSRDQWARRQALLGPVPKRLSAIDLDGDQALNFKYGEEFEVGEFQGRLNKASFEDLDAAEQAADAKAKADAAALADADAKAQADAEAGGNGD